MNSLPHRRSTITLHADEPTAREWQVLAAQTLAHYEQAAPAYREGTLDHDVSQNISALLDAIEGDPPFSILDFGCGPGRDLVRFRELGHEAIGLDGCHAFVDMARRDSGCEVWCQDFLALTLPPARFDGVFANASLFHVPRAALASVLAKLRHSLKPRGVLFSSNPRGDNREGFSGSRYGCYHDWPAWRAHLQLAGFDEVHHYYRPPGLPREQQPWLASVWRRRD